MFPWNLFKAKKPGSTGQQSGDVPGMAADSRKNLPATKKRAVPMSTVPANERVIQVKADVGMETGRAGLPSGKGCFRRDKHA
jgi:hypothetical protein